MANTYLRGNLSTEELTSSLGAISSRLSTLAINKGAAKVLVRDLSTYRSPASFGPSDRARHQLLQGMVSGLQLVRVDLLPPLDTEPTCFPTQSAPRVSGAGRPSSHIDVLAVEETLIHSGKWGIGAS